VWVEAGAGEPTVVLEAGPTDYQVCGDADEAAELLGQAGGIVDGRRRQAAAHEPAARAGMRPGPQLRMMPEDPAGPGHPGR
jgi:hypothetical protein